MIPDCVFEGEMIMDLDTYKPKQKIWEPRNGSGKWIENNGKIFKGKWEDGEFIGLITHENGTKYIGSSLSKSTSDGAGIWVDEDFCLEGVWDGGEFSGKATRLNGDNFIGKMQSKPVLGIGKWTFNTKNNKCKYEGTWMGN